LRLGLLAATGKLADDTAALPPAHTA